MRLSDDGYPAQNCPACDGNDKACTACLGTDDIRVVEALAAATEFARIKAVRDRYRNDNTKLTPRELSIRTTACFAGDLTAERVALGIAHALQLLEVLEERERDG